MTLADFTCETLILPQLQARDKSAEILELRRAVSAADAMGYLKLISGLARPGKDPDLLEQFKTAATAGELLELFRKLPIRGKN